jgi:hypothetical protein
MSFNTIRPFVSILAPWVICFASKAILDDVRPAIFATFVWFLGVSWGIAVVIYSRKNK